MGGGAWLNAVAVRRASATAGTTHLGIVAGLAMGPAVGLGFGRFAYALLLPAMRADLGWSYAVAGAMNTANAAGYLVGALAAAPIAARVGDKRGFLAGVLLTAVSLLATGLVTDIAVLALLRVVAGAAGALSLVTGGALAAAAGGGGGKGRPTLALGVYFGGAGFGMVVSAFAVPALVARSAGAAAGSRSARSGCWAPRRHCRRWHARRRWRCRAPGARPLHARATRGMRAVLASYVLFGAGYIAYTTFIVAYLRSRLGFDAAEVTLFWGCVGVAATSPAWPGGRCWRGCPADAVWRRRMPW